MKMAVMWFMLSQLLFWKGGFQIWNHISNIVQDGIMTTHMIQLFWSLLFIAGGTFCFYKFATGMIKAIVDTLNKY